MCLKERLSCCNTTTELLMTDPRAMFKGLMLCHYWRGCLLEGKRVMDSICCSPLFVSFLWGPWNRSNAFFSHQAPTTIWVVQMFRGSVLVWGVLFTEDSVTPSLYICTISFFYLPFNLSQQKYSPFTKARFAWRAWSCKVVVPSTEASTNKINLKHATNAIDFSGIIHMQELEQNICASGKRCKKHNLLCTHAI